MNRLIRKAAALPINEAVQAYSAAPVVLPAPERGIDLEMRVSAPATGGNLPIIVLSHGHGPSLYVPSLHGYGPLADFWAAHGFVVIQPTHMSAKMYDQGPDAPGAPLFWRSRVEDMSRIADELDRIEASVPWLAGRMDKSRLAAVGHSMGGQTVGMVLGARLTDPNDPEASDVDLRDTRYKAGVLLAAPGNGGSDLSPFAAENYTALNPDFSHMTTPALVVVGDKDESTYLTTRGAAWHADPYTMSPANPRKWLLTLFGAEHGLGGIAGYDAKETTDEDPDLQAAVQRLTWAYLRSALDPADPAWADARRALAEHAGTLGRIEGE